MNLKRVISMVATLLLAGICAADFSQAAPNGGGWKQKEFMITFWFWPPGTDEAWVRTKDRIPVFGNVFAPAAKTQSGSR
jgi:hypothetical protein